MNDESTPAESVSPASGKSPAKSIRGSVRRPQKKKQHAGNASERPSSAPISTAGFPEFAPSPSEETPDSVGFSPAAESEATVPTEHPKRKRRRRKGKGGGGNESISTVMDESEIAETSQGEPVKQESASEPREHRQPQPPRVRIDPEELGKRAWKIFLAEVSEEGVALINDQDARNLSRRCFRLAEIFLEEQSRKH